MLHYHALYVQCSQADTQVLCGKLHNSKTAVTLQTSHERERSLPNHNPKKGRVPAKSGKPVSTLD